MLWSKLDESLARRISDPRNFIRQLVLPSEQWEVFVHLENGEVYSATLTGNAIWELTDQPWVKLISTTALKG